MGHHGQHPAGGAIGLVDHFLDVLGIVRHSTEIDTVRGELHGTQFDVSFLEETVGVQGDLEHTGDLLCLGRGNHGGSQGEDIGIQLETLA